MGMFGDAWHMVIDLTEQGHDKICGGHGLLRSRQGFTLTSLEEGHDHFNSAN
jgi:hypothetical protein